MKRRAMQKDTHRNGWGGGLTLAEVQSLQPWLSHPQMDNTRSRAVVRCWDSVSLALVGEFLSSFACVTTSHRAMFGQQGQHRAFGAGQRVPAGTRRPSRWHQALCMHLTP